MPKNKTVCIVGAARCGKDVLYQEPKDVDMWGLNQVHRTLFGDMRQRFTAWFQIHPLTAVGSYYPEFQMHLDFLTSFAGTVYLNEESPLVPNGISFPYDDVCDSMGSNYFATNTICYMVALAIHQGYKEIKLYGCNLSDLDAGDSYARPSLEFLLGQAVGRGIEIWVPDDSALLKGNIYARTVMVPSTGVDLAINVLRRTLESMPLGGPRTRLHKTAEVLEELRNYAVDGRARHSKDWKLWEEDQTKQPFLDRELAEEGEPGGGERERP